MVNEWTRNEVWRIVAAHDPGDDEVALCRVNRLTDAVLALMSGADPAVFVVRESDVAAVKVTESDQLRRAGETGIPLPWKANKVREKRDECAAEWVELEAIARAIDAGQAVDPVEDKARELYRAATPDARWETVADEYRRIARHVLGQEDRHVDQ